MPELGVLAVHQAQWHMMYRTCWSNPDSGNSKAITYEPSNGSPGPSFCLNLSCPCAHSVYGKPYE